MTYLETALVPHRELADMQAMASVLRFPAPGGTLSCLAVAVSCILSAPALAATAPDLGSTSPFAVVSETFSNSTAGTTLTGDACFTTGPATTPTISGDTETPCAPEKGTDQNAALSDLNGQSCQSIGAAVALDQISIDGGTPGEFPPGCYSSAGAMSITTGTTVTLSGSGVYVFRADGALNAGTNSSIVAAGGACASDVYWTPTSSTTIGWRICRETTPAGTSITMTQTLSSPRAAHSAPTQTIPCSLSSTPLTLLANTSRV